MAQPPMVEAQKIKRPRSKVGIILIAAFIFAGVLTTFIYFVTRPKGVEIGELDVLKNPGQGIVEVDAKAGDKLYFRFDTLHIMDGSGGSTSQQRQRSILNNLRESTVVIETAVAGGASRSTSCPAYDSTMTSSTSTSTSYKMTGVNLACEVPIETAGRYGVRARVNWKQGLPVAEAKLEVRKSN
jgi:hypothetical protein